MIAWLKLNKFKIIGTIIVIIFSIANSCFSGRYMYNKAIKASDRVIVGIKQNMRDSATRADAAIERSLKSEKEARVARAEKEKHKANAARIEKKRRGLEKKIAALPPTQVVVHLVKILYVEPEEITLQSQGILFSLAAGRKTLRYMEEFTLLRQQFDELAMAFVESSVEGLELWKTNAELKKANAEKDVQIAKWPGIEKEWDRKFNLSKSQGKSNWWRGLKTGGIIGGIVGGIIVFVLRR